MWSRKACETRGSRTALFFQINVLIYEKPCEPILIKEAAFDMYNYILFCVAKSASSL